MTNWKLTLAYDGTPFHGWQVQPRLPTIQGTVAEALRQITGESVLPQGSGRTDAGVHALAQIASFQLKAAIPAGNLLRALNRKLPPAIRVLAVEQAAPDFHARHSALRKTYEYRIFPRVKGLHATPDRVCPPWLAPFVWDCPWPLDLARAQQAASRVLGTHDFTSFAAVDHEKSFAGQEHTPCRTIFHSAFNEADGLVLYRVTGSGFLHHMVRNLVGTFVDVAAGRNSPDAIPRILAARARCSAGPTAPARGLFLAHVDYPVPPSEHGGVPDGLDCKAAP